MARRRPGHPPTTQTNKVQEGSITASRAAMPAPARACVARPAGRGMRGVRDGAHVGPPSPPSWGARRSHPERPPNHSARTDGRAARRTPVPRRSACARHSSARSARPSGPQHLLARPHVCHPPRGVRGQTARLSACRPPAQRPLSRARGAGPPLPNPHCVPAWQLARPDSSCGASTRELGSGSALHVCTFICFMRRDHHHRRPALLLLRSPPALRVCAARALGARLLRSPPRARAQHHGCRGRLHTPTAPCPLAGQCGHSYGHGGGGVARRTPLASPRGFPQALQPRCSASPPHRRPGRRSRALVLP